MALDRCQNFCFCSISLELRQNETKFSIQINIDKIKVEYVNHHFLKICNRVTALDRCQPTISTQYFENELTDFDQIWYTAHSYGQDLGENC